jgi:hypothetical protein
VSASICASSPPTTSFHSPIHAMRRPTSRHRPWVRKFAGECGGRSVCTSIESQAMSVEERRSMTVPDLIDVEKVQLPQPLATDPSGSVQEPRVFQSAGDAERKPVLMR